MMTDERSSHLYGLFMAWWQGCGKINPHLQAGLLFALRRAVRDEDPGQIATEIGRWYITLNGSQAKQFQRELEDIYQSVMAA